DPQLQSWLAEGLSHEIHTIDHPCPLLKDGDFKKAKKTYDDCVDLLQKVPGNSPVAFRMPCCDSLNTVSPRAFAEIFNRTTAEQRFLQIDTSVFNVITSKDPELPREIAIDEEGRERFRKYLPADRTFVNTIENYPYPYVIGGICWEFPCVTPSDWSAQHFQKPNNPLTVRDWKAYLDAVVVKQGTFNLVFHPHGWITSEQIVEFIDYAQSKYGQRVKFLTFREAIERINRSMLAGQPLRHADGLDNGVRVLDVNNDGYLDVVVANEQLGRTRLWDPESKRWKDIEFPVAIVRHRKNASSTPDTNPHGERTSVKGAFGILSRDGFASFYLYSQANGGLYRFDGRSWVYDSVLLKSLELDGQSINVSTSPETGLGVLFRDIDGDGFCELIFANRAREAVLHFHDKERVWKQLPYDSLVSRKGVKFAGVEKGALKFVDIDEDGHDDVIISDETSYQAWLFTSLEHGWNNRILFGNRPEKNEIPPISRQGANNGAWFHSRHMFVQNEDTAGMKDLVARVSFDKMLEGVAPQAKEPEQSRSLIETRPGFAVELMAAEPMVLDPVAFEWGADGRLWVAEMADYPLGIDNNGKSGGRVRVLEDTDNDGRYDRSSLFLDGLNFPNGVMPWRNGVLVSAAPEIIYAEDTDGDGKADKRETLLQGFVEGNQQHRVNGFSYGLDNWIYCANGDSDGEILSTKTGKKTSIRGYDFRFRPDTGEMELEAGKTQFGRNRDDWGNWFGSSNSDPMYHFVIAEQYLRRNPSLAISNNRHAISEGPGPAPVFPISRALARFNDFDRLNRFTSACSAVVYRDDLFGPEFRGNAFISEPVHNLVHREIVSPNGLTFASRRAADEAKSEFLASRDNWFRPTMVKVGPDGALWIADMYRHLIEHPQYIPKEQWDQLPMREGEDRGRIYRIYPTGKKPRAIPRFDKLSTAELVAALESPNGWQRDTIQRLLVERSDKAAIPILSKLVTDSQQPLARLHSLCTLDGLEALSNELLQFSLADQSPGVRRHAVRLVENRIAADNKPARSVLELAQDGDAQVRLQVALSLGAWSHAEAHAALAQLLKKDGGDAWFVNGILSSLRSDSIVTVLGKYLEDREQVLAQPELTGRIFALATATVGDQPEELSQVLDLLFAAGEKGSHPAWQFAALAEALDAGARRRDRFWRTERGRSLDLSKQRGRIAEMAAVARPIVADEKASERERITAIRLLARDDDTMSPDLDRLESLLAPNHAVAIQSAAVQRLAQLRDERSVQILLGGWRGYSPELRGQVLDALLSRFGGSALLLDALESGKISAGEISAERRERLLKARFRAVSERAEKVFSGATSPDRQKILEQYRASLAVPGDVPRGEKSFAKTCAACHRIGNVGHVVGPDLAALKDRSPEALLMAIFDPSRAIESKFLNFVAVTKSGQTFTGILASESGGSITLLGPDGKSQTLLRQEIEELASTGKSAMPEGLEKDLSPEDVADLIAYLQQIDRRP
ncbi:MAG: PVC-type heme-binding CxxCH protein, partial [Planctomycetaceae bacterium]